MGKHPSREHQTRSQEVRILTMLVSTKKCFEKYLVLWLSWSSSEKERICLDQRLPHCIPWSPGVASKTTRATWRWGKGDGALCLLSTLNSSSLIHFTYWGCKSSLLFEVFYHQDTSQLRWLKSTGPTCLVIFLSLWLCGFYVPLCITIIRIHEYIVSLIQILQSVYRVLLVLLKGWGHWSSDQAKWPKS